MKVKWLCLVGAWSLAMGSSLVVAGETADLEEVVVTAQKRAERTIDVPMSLTVMSEKELDERGIRSLEDISYAVPGLAMRVDGPGSLELFMRGIGNLGGAEALTSVYMDEVPTTLYLFRQLDLRSLDLDHVEVLKGPQGTLYGQGAAAGTVRFITRNPELNEFEGHVDGDFSTIDHGATNEKATGIVNIPIINDKLAMRIAATGETGGGWIDQPQAGIKNGNNQDLYDLRAKILWKPVDALQILGTVAGYRLTSVLGLNYENADHDFVMAMDRASRIKPRLDQYTLYNLTGTYDLGFATLTSASSYIDYYRQYALPYITPVQSMYDPVGGNLEGVSTYNDQSFQFTQEVRLVSKGLSRFNYTVGAFYRDVHSNFTGNIATLYDNVVLTPYLYTSDNGSKSVSVFADGSVRLGDFTIGAGVRSFKDDSSLFDGTTTQAATFKSTDPRAYVDYALAPDVKIYGSFAKGFRSGGFNSYGQPSYGPEKIYNYEIGAKGVLPDPRVSFEVAAYLTNYRDMIRRGLVIVDQQFENIAANIGLVRIKGLEAGLGWKATDHLSFTASGSYIHAVVVTVDSTNSSNEPGDPADYVPKWAYTLGGDYTFTWTSGVDGFFHMDVDHRDKVLYTDRQMYYAPYVTQASDSFTVLGARLGARWRHTSLELYGTNLTNENKNVDPFQLWSQANRTKPRTIGVRAGYDF